MTKEEAIKLLKMSEQAIWLKGLEKERKEAEEMAIKSLEAWEKVRAEIERLTITEGGEDYIRKMAELFSLKIKVLQIIDKHLSEVSE